VESRRSALERMLNKIAGHLILQHDGDLKIFLESEAFSVDVKARERKDPDMPQESKGMFSGLSLSVGSGTKYIEHDDVGCIITYSLNSIDIDAILVVPRPPCLSRHT
jgi:sorting nexin-1/2